MRPFECGSVPPSVGNRQEGVCQPGQETYPWMSRNRAQWAEMSEGVMTRAALLCGQPAEAIIKKNGLSGWGSEDCVPGEGQGSPIPLQCTVH